MVQGNPPIDLEPRSLLWQDGPADPQPDARQGLRVGSAASGVPAPTKINELGKLEPILTGQSSPQWPASHYRGQVRVVPDQRSLPATPNRQPPTPRDLPQGTHAA